MDFAQEELEGFVSNNFSPVTQNQINDALAVFITFSYAKPFEELDDVLSTATVEISDVTQLSFLEKIKDGLRGLCEVHYLEINPDTSMATLTELLTGLYRVAGVEDPTPYLRILETTEYTNEEKLARLLESLTTVDAASYLEAIVEARDTIIRNIYTLLEAREEAKEEKPDLVHAGKLRDMAAKLKDYLELHGKDCFVLPLCESGVKVGWPLALYLPLVSHEVNGENPEHTARNMLGLFLMALDTFEKPEEAFKEHSELLLTDLSTIQAVETRFINYLGELRSYRDTKRMAAGITPQTVEANPT